MKTVCGIVRAIFSALRYINDGRGLPGYKVPELDHVSNVLKSNVEVYQTCSQNEAADFQSHQILAIRSLRNTDVGEKLYCHYSNSDSLNTNELNDIVCVVL